MGWLIVEVSLLLISICLTLNIILGADGGTFVSSVAGNAQRFLRDIPSGTVMGIILIVGLYWFVKNRSK